MKDETKKIIRDKIDSIILQMQMKGVKLSPNEEFYYREGIAIGVSLSVLFHNDLEMDEIMDACGLSNYKNGGGQL